MKTLIIYVFLISISAYAQLELPKYNPGDISVYAMTVRDAERITGFDFFPGLPDGIEEKLKTSLDMGKWG